MAGPLTGIRVLDLTRIMAGPWCTQILADLGAEVIKIERPIKGDDTRQWGPPWLKDKDGNDSDQSAYFLSANRGKHSLTVDINSKEGQQIIKDLTAQSDVFIENFKVGGLEAKGLSYQALSQDQPALIYLSITGYGQTGPRAEEPGYDYLMQAMSGLMSITGIPDGEAGEGPMRVGVPIGDLTAGMYAAIGITSALYHCSLTGKGQYIDLSLFDTQMGWLANQAQNYFTSGKPPERTGKWHVNLAPYQPFKCQDGYVIIAVGNDNQFQKLMSFIGHPEISDDARFSTNPARNKNRPALEKIIEAKTIQHPCQYWLDHLPKNGVPCGPINRIDQAFQEEQAIHRKIKITQQHAVDGQMSGIANPLKLSKTPLEYHKAPPILGEDNDDVLSRILRLSDEEIAQLKHKKII